MAPFQFQQYDSGLTITIALIISCVASFRSLFSNRDNRPQPARYIPPSSKQRFLAGKSRRQLRDPNALTESFANISALENNSHGSDLEGSPIQSDLSAKGIRVKHEVDLTHETL